MRRMAQQTMPAATNRTKPSSTRAPRPCADLLANTANKYSSLASTIKTRSHYFHTVFVRGSVGNRRHWDNLKLLSQPKPMHRAVAFMFSLDPILESLRDKGRYDLFLMTSIDPLCELRSIREHPIVPNVKGPLGQFGLPTKFLCPSIHQLHCFSATTAR